MTRLLSFLKAGGWILPVGLALYAGYQFQIARAKEAGRQEVWIEVEAARQKSLDSLSAVHIAATGPLLDSIDGLIQELALAVDSVEVLQGRANIAERESERALERLAAAERNGTLDPGLAGDLRTVRVALQLAQDARKACSEALSSCQDGIEAVRDSLGGQLALSDSLLGEQTAAAARWQVLAQGRPGIVSSRRLLDWELTVGGGVSGDGFALQDPTVFTRAGLSVARFTVEGLAALRVRGGQAEPFALVGGSWRILP